MIIGMGKESITMLMEVGEWNDDKGHGKGIFKYADVDVYDGEWKGFFFEVYSWRKD